MKFGTLLRMIGGRRSKEQPRLVLPHRGGGRLEKPTPAPTGEEVPPKWRPPTKGTAPADRKPKRRRYHSRRRRARTALK